MFYKRNMFDLFFLRDVCFAFKKPPKYNTLGGF